MTGHELIEQERTRQIEVEGFDNDRVKYAGNELEQAALAYENNNYFQWPWSDKWWKPTPNDPVRQLVKAGALYQAEADRISDILQNAYNRRLKIAQAYERCLLSVDRCAMKIEKALKLKEETVPCVNCGKPWDTTKHNACSCGAYIVNRYPPKY